MSPGFTDHVPSVRQGWKENHSAHQQPRTCVPVAESHGSRRRSGGRSQESTPPAAPQGSWSRGSGPASVPSSACFKDVAIFWAKATIVSDGVRALCPRPPRTLSVIGDNCVSEAPSGSRPLRPLDWKTVSGVEPQSVQALRSLVTGQWLLKGDETSEGTIYTGVTGWTERGGQHRGVRACF